MSGGGCRPCKLPLAAVVVALAILAPLSPAYPQTQEHRIESFQAEWFPALPVTVLKATHDAVDPVPLRTGSGVLLVAAESRSGRGILLSYSRDDGATWESPRAVAAAPEGRRITAGAGGVLSSGRVVLALHEWQDTPGQVAWVREEPRGVHHYSWTGFRRVGALRILLSDDEGKTWTGAACDTAGGPIAPSSMGRAFAEKDAVWLAVYGPADQAEMDAALSSVGLMRSDDGGESWRFSHWLVRADKDNAIGYGPGEVIVLPDGRWLGMLQADYRGPGDYKGPRSGQNGDERGYLLGDHKRPRICRTLSSDAGRTWTTPLANTLGPKPSLLLLDRDQLMVGTRQDRGVIYNVMLNAGADLLYQDHLWASIWYQGGDRGGLHLAYGTRAVTAAAFTS